MVNVYSAMVNIRSAVRNIKQKRYHEKYKMAVDNKLNTLFSDFYNPCSDAIIILELREWESLLGDHKKTVSAQHQVRLR